MKKIQEQMIEAFKERFVLDPARVFFGDTEELKKQGWEVGKSQLIVRQDAKPGEIEAFLLEWSDKLLQEERAEWVKKIEGMKKEGFDSGCDDASCPCSKTDFTDYEKDFNEACADLIQLIQGEKV